MNRDHLYEDLCGLVAAKPQDVVVVVAAGVTIGALHGSGLNELASWRGLLESGLDRAVEIGKLQHDDAQRLRGLLDSEDADFWILAAEKITTALGGREGGEFRRWLRETVGAFSGAITDHKVLHALRALSEQGVLLATVNYDGLLEVATGYRSFTWRQSSDVERVLRGDEKGILHLHGYWEDPASVVLGVRSYDEVVRDEHAREVLRSMRMQKTFVFVGHGAGLADPNWGTFLRWTQEVFAASEHRHFRLVREDERSSVQAQHPAGQRIFALSYGKSHVDLGPFLESLVPANTASATLMTSATLTTSAAATTSSTAAEEPPVTTVIILVNIGERDHHWLEERVAIELAGVAKPVVFKVEMVVDRRSMHARDWREIAVRLETMVVEACAVKGRVEFLVMGAAPLPVFAYLGQRMRRMPGPIRVVNRRQRSHLIDVVTAPEFVATSSRDRFQVAVPSLGRDREGRVVFAILCSREYGYDEEMTEPMIKAEGASLLCSYTIRDPKNSHWDDPMAPDELPVLLNHLNDAEAWRSQKCPQAEGRVVALGGPSWVAFWVGVQLNPNVQGRLDFPNFVPGEGYVRALASPMHKAPWFTGKAKILFMTSEPDTHGRVRGSKAAETIKLALKRELGDDGPFEFEISGAADATELMREIELARPDILHLHLHGNQSGALCFEDNRGKPQPVGADNFVEMLKLTGVRPSLIVLCACHSAALAKKLGELAECVISMTTEIHYKAANTFSCGFYGALARGQTIANAIGQGTQLTVVQPPTIEQKVKVYVGDGIDAAEIVFFAQRK